MLRLSGESARVEWQDTASQNLSGFAREQQEQRSYHEDRPDPQWEGAVDNSAWLGKAPLLLTDQTDDRPSFSQLAVPFVIIVTIPVDGEALYKIVGQPIPSPFF